MAFEAWITTTLTDEDVVKAIVLAGSLRRVKTSKKLVVLTTSKVTQDGRSKLEGVFDLVAIFEPKTSNGLNTTEEWGKLYALSLTIFNKCVYLSPNALVVKNCDGIFHDRSLYAAYHDGNDWNTSVWLFTPNVKCKRAFENDNNWNKKNARGFLAWMIGKGLKINKLDEKYNMILSLDKAKDPDTEVCIASFSTNHPCEMRNNISKEKLGPMELFVFNLWTKIHKEVTTDLGFAMDALTVKHDTEPIAVVGLSFRLPKANNVNEFWNLLVEGKEGIQPVPSDRWLKERAMYPCRDRKIEAGFLNVPIDQFDAKFFGISPKDAEYLDPQQRLLHEISWEALEEAMIDPLSLQGTQTGFFIGSWLHDYHGLVTSRKDLDFLRCYMGNSLASSAARLSHFYGTTGPSVGTESGCSAGIVAVDMAMKSLRNKTSNLALAGGVNLLIHPFDHSQLEVVVAPDNRCKTFDASANGFGRAEGCAFLVMKRLSDAVRDGDNIWGLLRGSAMRQEGTSKSLGTPTVHSESLAMELALADAGVSHLEVSYIETHGTGTPVGDPLEVAAITKAYSKGRTEPVLLGSVKTNVGHTESVSGITGIIKVLLSMKHEMIPKHLNLKNLNPAINLSLIPAEIPLNNVPWPKKPSTPRIAGVSSFGISGTDAHVIVEEPPLLKRAQPALHSTNDRPLHILKISAKTEESLNELLQKYKQAFAANPEGNLADIAYTANTGRSNFNHRAVIIAKDSAEALKIIEEKSYKEAAVHTSGSKLCFLFTGQGSQYPNMASNLYATSPVFKYYFDRCDDILESSYGISLKSVLWENSEELSRTLYSQTSIFVVEYCLLKLWETIGVKADYVLGHSLGEFAAAVAAGALTFKDALMLVAERSRLIDNLPQGKMLVIRADKKTVDSTILAYQQNNKDFMVDYAAVNSKDQTVISGDSKMIEEFSRFCGSRSLKTIVLAATHAFHSRHMDPMLEQYRKIASSVQPSKESSPLFISGMEGRQIETESIDADYWVRHTREKVSFIDACKAVQSEGCTMFLEVGPHPVLSAMAMMNIEERITCLPSIRRKEDEWSTMLDTLGKLYLSEWDGRINWKGFDKFYTRNRFPVPFYQFYRKSIWTKFERVRADLHPLLGKILPTASKETIFENTITLKNTNYIEDHVIGNTIIFPGAGYLEMCLVGGQAATQGLSEQMLKPRRPVALNSLTISSPLALSDSEDCRLQTTIFLSNCSGDNLDSKEIGYSISVYHYGNEGSDQFTSHASAKYFPVVETMPKEVPILDINLKEIQDTWTSITDKIKRFYQKTLDVGLRFGPRFQTLKSGWGKGSTLLSAIDVPQDYKDYLVHPLVADSMLQTFMLWKQNQDGEELKLQVPFHIGKFIWLKEADSKTQYTYCSTNDSGESYCLLLDQNGSPLAYMSNIQFIVTTVKLIEGMARRQNTTLPKIWKEVWKSSPGPLQGSMDTSSKTEIEFDEATKQLLERSNDVGDEEKRFYENIINLTKLYILNALYELGWKPQTGEAFSIEGIMKSLGINPKHKRYLRFFLKFFAEEGPNNELIFIQSPPTLENVREGLKFITSHQDTNRIEYRLIHKTGKALASILTDNTNLLSLLFTEDPNEPTAAEFYEGLMSWTNKVQHPVIFDTLRKMREASEELHGKGRGTGRFLEIGAGSGAATKSFLKNLAADEMSFEYYFTDISSAFFIPAEKLLSEYSNVIFKKFDMERDPLEQGYCPGYFDVIIACEVIHVAEDMKNTLKNIRSLLKPGGLFIIFEHIVPDPRITFMFGLLDGYWRCKDRDHATLTEKTWKKSLKEADFDRVYVTPYYNNVHGIICAFASSSGNANHLLELHPKINSWLVFSEDTQFTSDIMNRLNGVNRYMVSLKKSEINVGCEETMKTVIKAKVKECLEDGRRLEGILYLWGMLNTEDIFSQDQSEISLPFVTCCQIVAISSTTYFPNIYSVTRGLSNVEPVEVPNPNSGTLIGLIRSISNENTSLNLTNFDLPPNENAEDYVHEVFQNLWMPSKETSVSFRNGNRLVPKFVETKIHANDPLTLPNGCKRFQLILPETRVMSDLEYSYLENYTLAEGEVEVEVAAIALNFRDVFTVLKPTKQFEQFNSLGLEFSGVVTRVGANVTRRKIGDRVIGINYDENLSMPSHVKVDENTIVPLPSHMTFAEAATLPAVFITAAYCLLQAAQLKKGETILIHTASGGVGLCAIQLAQYIGANIIATAGSPRKRKYLQNLGIQHIFNSRTTDFGKEVLELTEGKGVHVILNSLTGEGFKEASLGALAKNGRFIEMSKLNVWTPEKVKELRPDVFYQIADVTNLAISEKHVVNKTLEEYLLRNIIKPIAYERFDALNIRGALSYMQQAKHIGKIVCTMPEIKIEMSTYSVDTPLFNDCSTYLVTGGLGGIGWEVVKWMLQKGAKHIAVASRSHPKPEITAQISSWNKSGKHVETFSVDVGNFEECQKLLDIIASPHSKFPQLRGVMHAAGVLQDAILENQNWSRFRQTYNAKIRGTWNLHHLTVDLQLEHFVLFSSVAALFGSPSQGNHCGSNSFMDAFAFYRRSNGLPATSINWGNWGEVGVATEIDFPGILPITTSQGLLALETLLRTQNSHMAIINIDSFALSLKYFPTLKSYVEDSRLFGETKSTVIVNSDEFWKEVDNQGDLEGKKNAFKKYIKITARSILKMSPDEVLDDSADFQSLGIDSLMMLEMRNGMQNILGSRLTLSVNQLKDCSNAEQLASRLIEILMGKENENNGKDKSDEIDLKMLIRQDSKIIPNSFQEGKEPKRHILASQIETVFITGATGNIGPFMLKDFSKKAQVKKIICLVRTTKDGMSAADRVQRRLEDLQILGSVDMSKVQCLEGDITKDKLGLNVELYNTLAETVDAVVHCAAMVDFNSNYSPNSPIREVNVFGMLRILELAGSRKVKHVLFPSTLMSVTEVDQEGNIPETWQDVGAFDNMQVNMGYTLTKHVSEQIIKNLVKDYGLPCKVFRLPYVGGSSETGKVEVANNQVLLRWLTFMKLGCMPDVPAPIAAVAVDRCSEICLDVFFNPKAPSGVYHVIQKDIEMEQELVEIAKDLGIFVDTVPYPEFKRRLHALVKDQEQASNFESVQRFYETGESTFGDRLDSGGVKSLKSYWEKSGRVMNKLKISEYAPEFQEDFLETMRTVMRRDLMYLLNSGVFKQFGINL